MNTGTELSRPGLSPTVPIPRIRAEPLASDPVDDTKSDGATWLSWRMSLAPLLSSVSALTAEIATGTFRQEDLIGRLGGEEFGIVLVGEEAGVRKRLEALRAAIAGATILRERPVTVSIGYAIALPGDPVALDALLKIADNALYKAKGSGRNRVMPDLADPSP